MVETNPEGLRKGVRWIDGDLWFTDLPALVVGPFMPAAGPGAGWFPFSIGLEHLSCTGLATGAFSPAGELVLDLGLQGWYRLHIAQNPALRVWLDGEPGYWEMPGDERVVRDYPLPAADLTGRCLHVAPVRGAELSRELRLFYIRAEPCRGEEPPRRNLVATNDGHGVFFRGLDSSHDLWRHVTPYRDSDFFRLVWGLYGGCLLTMRPDTRAGESPLRSDEGSFRAGDWVFNRSLRRLQAAGVDPLAVIRAATREYGLELHFYLRMAAFYGPFPKMDWTTSFFREHPEWHGRDEEGRRINVLSYAWPGVRARVLAFMEELLDYEPEGLCLAFNRGLPMIFFDEPVIERYQRQYGRIPRLPHESETPELLGVRQAMLVEFVAEAARLCERRGRVLSCIVPRDFDRCRRLGLDPEDLVRRGLVESVLVGAGHGDPPELAEDLGPLRLLKQRGGRVYAGGSAVRAHGAAWPPEDLPTRLRRMLAIHEAGLDGAWFWDAETIIGCEWETHRRFGNRALLEQMAAGRWPRPTVHETRSIHDLVIGRYNPWHAY
jgi:hypothetical protein